MASVTITLIGGPTALIEIGGFRLLTDPTFDQPGEYLSAVTLNKLAGPALSAGEVGKVDAILLSHDQHFDNLDRAGRAFLGNAGEVLTTVVGASRLGGETIGLKPWESRDLRGLGKHLRVTATPARHGPVGIEPIAGEVIGFVVEDVMNGGTLYFTGDTVWYKSLEEVGHRFSPDIVFPFAGAAQTRGPFNLTMSTNDVVEAADYFASAMIVPLHYSGWAHFTQGEQDLMLSFEILKLSERLTILEPGVPRTFDLAKTLAA